MYYFYVIWLPQCQLWAIIGSTPDLLNDNHYIIQFQPKSHQEPFNEIGSMYLANWQVEFELQIFQFHHNALTHLATLFLAHLFNYLSQMSYRFTKFSKYFASVLKLNYWFAFTIFFVILNILLIDKIFEVASK